MKQWYSSNLLIEPNGVLEFLNKLDNYCIPPEHIKIVKNFIYYYYIEEIT